MSKVEISSEAVSRDVATLERKLDQLKREYDAYFNGFAKLAPMSLRNEVNALVRKYSGVSIQNTGLNFKFNSLTARFNAFAPRWDRALREIEEGTYKRDLFRLKIKEREQQGQVAEKQKKPSAAKQPDVIGQLFDQYLSSRQKNSESVQGLSREKLEKVIKTQAAEIKKRYKCKSVSFKVVTENGKTKLKAIPK